MSSLEVLLVDINLQQESKKISTLTSVQELFNITDSNLKNIVYNSSLVVKCPFCSQLVTQLLSSKMIVGGAEEMEQFDFVNNPGGNLINATQDLSMSAAQINNLSHAPMIHESENSGMGGKNGAATSMRQMQGGDPHSMEE